MTRRGVESIIAALNASGVRYLVAGGLAVVAHGHVRFTADVDVLLDLGSPELPRALGALQALGYRPRAPVPLEAFANASERTSWAREKHMTVFSLNCAGEPATEIDLFVESPLDFETCWRRAVRLEVAPGVEATFVALADLVEMKRRAGRPQDLEDIARLAELHPPTERP